jgi:hypothetical protein
MRKLFTKKLPTARQTYIKMLSDRVSAIDSSSAEQRGHFLWSELIASGYLNGVTKTDAMGLPTGNVVTSPTVKGRLFLQELTEKEFEDSLRGKLKSWSLPAIAYLGGIASAVLADFIKNVFGV